MLENFAWGPEFLRINEDVLEMYCKANGPAEVRAAEAAYLEAGRAERDARRTDGTDSRLGSEGATGGGGYCDGMDLPPMDSESSEDTSDTESVEEATEDAAVVDACARLHIES